MPELHFRTCNLCEAMCGVRIEHEAGRVLSIRGDVDDPFSRGHVCPKAVALQDVHADPDRLRRPVRRRGRDFEEVSWDVALEEAAGLLAGVQERHGRHALAVYQGNPVVHGYATLLGAQVFVRALHTRSHFSASSLDQMPHQLAQYLMFGHQLLFTIPDVDHTQYLLMLGANPLASNGSLMTAPGIERRLKELRARGGRLVVVDPRRTETAALADEHLAIQPGTDALFLLALLHVLAAEGLFRLDRLQAFTDGVDEIRRLAEPFAPEHVAGRTGISAETTRRIARDLAAAPRAVAYGRMGLSTQPFGALCCWLLNVVNVVTGNLDRVGGSMFTRPAADLAALGSFLGQRGSYARRRSRVSGRPEVGGEFPTAVLAEEIETPGEGQIRGLVTIAGNPVLSSPNGRRLDRALSGLEAMVSLDMYVNETSRHAHLILPPASPLERDHYDLVFHALAVRNTAKYSLPLFPRPEGTPDEYDVLVGLAERLQRRQGARLRERLATKAAARLGARGLLALALRTGPWGPRLGLGGGVTLGRLEKEPHGIDLGPLQPRLPEALETPGRRIDLAPAPLVADVDRLRDLLAAPQPALALIGRRQLRSNNSWLHNAQRLMNGPDRCTLLMHPDDAAARSLASGARVRVSSRVGEVVCPVEVTADMRPGVVSLPHGFGHDREGVRLSVAGAHAGASLNDLTDDARLDVFSGNAAFNGVPVEVVTAG
jgi:anaerobic selenocysteine-containing dehydrogenase